MSNRIPKKDDCWTLTDDLLRMKRNHRRNQRPRTFLARPSTPWQVRLRDDNRQKAQRARLADALRNRA